MPTRLRELPGTVRHQAQFRCLECERAESGNGEKAHTVRNLARVHAMQSGHEVDLQTTRRVSIKVNPVLR